MNQAQNDNGGRPAYARFANGCTFLEVGRGTVLTTVVIRRPLKAPALAITDIQGVGHPEAVALHNHLRNNPAQSQTQFEAMRQRRETETEIRKDRLSKFRVV